MSWLGLMRMPEKIADLSIADTGLTADDLALLQADIEAARKTARGFTRSFVPQKGSRTLLARRPAQGSEAASA